MRYLIALLAALPMTACASRVRPGVGVSNDGSRVGLDLGQYDTTFAHPVTGVAPGEACTGPDCGVPDPVVPVRKSQIDAARREMGGGGVSATVLVVAVVGLVLGVGAARLLRAK